MKTTRIATVLALALALAALPVGAEDVAAEVRATFEKFVAAQNAHDAAAVGALLIRRSTGVDSIASSQNTPRGIF